ncbi:MAG: hypothetical protein KU29_03235 [Sulfurovum sp. FS06-10]|nr:MAG: hypothetical protein KU29_03235 [Sulfurovum sp. FS06-10]
MGYKKFLFFLILFLSLGYSAGANTIDMSIVTGNDDAEERNSNGAMYLDSSDLELIQDGSKMQSVGLRFVFNGISEQKVGNKEMPRKECHYTVDLKIYEDGALYVEDFGTNCMR